MFRLILKSRYVFLNFTTARILAPTFNKCGILFLWKEERSLQSFKLILIDLPYIESQKYKLCNITSFKFTAYNAYISLQKASNFMVKHLTRSHFLGVFL